MASTGEPATTRPSPSVALPATSGNSTLVQHLEDEEDTATYAIVMPAEYQVKEGAQLWTGVRLGKFLGAGVQAKVFQLARDDGTPIGKVIKINHADIGSKILNNNVLWIGMDREWEIGTQLRAALQVPGGEVPGFMKVCDCLVARKGNQAAFSGMLMGELHGWEVYKRVDTPEFHNIHYVREMLFQTFSALDRAQRKLGFHHADLGMRNIMEHYPKIWEELSAEQGQQAEAEAKKFPGYSCTADGKRLPLGPQLEFKIIDFGVAKFSSKLAAAAAGSQAQEVVERLHEQRERIKFGSAHSRTSIEFEPSDVTEDETRMSKLRKIFKTPRNRLTVVISPVLKPMKQLVAHTRKDSSSGQADASGSESKASHDGGDGNGDGNGNGHGGDAASAAVEEYQPVRLAAFQKPGYLQAEGDVAASRNRLSASGKKGRRKKKKSPIETIYRHFWHRKGDVFHLLLGIALALDDRIWPEEDEDEVQELCSLVHHVTGIKLRATTAEGPPGAPAFGRHKWQHWFRRWGIRLKGHILPFNSGLLAREALSHPFFGTPTIRHAEIPVPLTCVFPTAD